jgi:serine/threonine-protein kinase
MVGKTFADYEVLGKLAQGGMATIYLAIDDDGNHYALRVLLPQLESDRTYVRRFSWGCDVLSHMDHPNIVRLFKHGESRDHHYAVLEYVPGPNLKERILRREPQLVPNRLKLLVGMASALAHIHQRGYLHLDFKPENVVVPKTFDPKLIDLDLAIERPSEPKRLSTNSGTPSYLAPEQIAKEPVDERADIFSFGITAYEMIAGYPPITGESPREILEKYANFKRNVRPLRNDVPDLPAHIEEVIFKCLEKDVARRYPSMGLVARDLQS